MKFKFSLKFINLNLITYSYICNIYVKYICVLKIPIIFNQIINFPKDKMQKYCNIKYLRVSNAKSVVGNGIELPIEASQNRR